MKKIKKSHEPPKELTDYLRKHPVGDPKHTWEAFCDDTDAKRAVHAQLRRDQRGLCAYCEINVYESDAEVKIPDVKVEHFHPKSDKRDPTRSWELDWNNLFLCCQGGEREVDVPKDDRYENRFIKERRCRHCDVPKKNKVLDGEILNPLDIPAFPSLFREVGKDRQDERDAFDAGRLELEPDEDACNAVSHDRYVQAKNTIRKLRLNSPNLATMRRATVVAIEEEIRKRSLALGVSPKEASASVFAALFRSDRLPAFFTAIRVHFGEIVEKRLREIDYDG